MTWHIFQHRGHQRRRTCARSFVVLRVLPYYSNWFSRQPIVALSPPGAELRLARMVPGAVNLGSRTTAYANEAAFGCPRLCELGSVFEVHWKRFWIALIGRYAFSPLRGPPTTTLQPLLKDRETRLADDVEAVHFDFNENNRFPPGQKTLRISKSRAVA